MHQSIDLMQIVKPGGSRNKELLPVASPHRAEGANKDHLGEPGISNTFQRRLSAPKKESLGAPRKSSAEEAAARKDNANGSASFSEKMKEFIRNDSHAASSKSIQPKKPPPHREREPSGSIEKDRTIAVKEGYASVAEDRQSAWESSSGMGNPHEDGKTAKLENLAILLQEWGFPGEIPQAPDSAWVKELQGWMESLEAALSGIPVDAIANLGNIPNTFPDGQIPQPGSQLWFTGREGGNDLGAEIKALLAELAGEMQAIDESGDTSVPIDPKGEGFPVTIGEENGEILEADQDPGLMASINRQPPGQEKEIASSPQAQTQATSPRTSSGAFAANLFFGAEAAAESDSELDGLDPDNLPIVEFDEETQTERFPHGGRSQEEGRGERPFSGKEARTSFERKPEDGFQLPAGNNTVELLKAAENTLTGGSKAYTSLSKGTEFSVLGQISGKMVALVQAGRSEIQIQLKPEHLGKVQIALSLQDGLMNGKIRVENEAVRQMVEANMAGLRDSLDSQGIKLQNLEVSVDQQQRSLLNSDGQSTESFLRRREGQARETGPDKSDVPELAAQVRADTGRRLGYNTLELIA